MAYLGRQPVLGNFVKLDAISVVNGQAAYTMQNGSVNFTDYSTVNQFLVSLNGTIQSPGSSFSVSSSTITFSSNLVTGDVIDFIIVFGNSLSSGVPTDATVTAAKLGANSVTAAKLNSDIISGTTAMTSTPADTDEFLVSNSGVLNRVDYSLIKGGGGAYEFVERSAVGGSNVGSMNFINLSTSHNYLFQWNGIDSTSNSDEDFYAQVTANGSSFRTSDYKSACFQFYSDGGEDSFSASSGFALSENQVGSEVNSGNCGFLYLMNLAASQKTAVVGENVTVGDSSNRVRANVFGGFHNSAEAITGLRFIFQSGDISASSAGFITVYKQVIA